MNKLALLLALLLAAPAHAQDMYSLKIGPLERYYWLALSPIDATAEKPTSPPLLIVLHGERQNVKSLWRMQDLMVPALKAGFVIATPQAAQNQWHDVGDNLIDDVQMTRSLIDTLAKQNNIDPKRVYVVGAAGGGRMALRLACEMADKLAGVAAVAATLPRPVDYSCTPAKPIPVVLFNGTEDPLNPWDGNVFKNTRTTPRMSPPQTAEFWARKNGCTTPAVTVLPDVNTADGSVVKLAHYASCQATTQLYALDGAGHSWPGSGPLADSAMGSTNKDISASAIILDFFAPAKQAAK